MDLAVVFGLLGDQVVDEKTFLRLFHRKLADDNRFEISDDPDGAIAHKVTVEFRARGIAFDVTACVGAPERFHDQSKQGDILWKEIEGKPLLADVTLCVVDWAKRCADAVHSKGRVQGRLKGIHWFLMVLAWWKDRGEALSNRSGANVDMLVLDALSTFRDLRFDVYKIVPFAERPFAERFADRLIGQDAEKPIVLINPFEGVWKGTNLAAKVSQESAVRIKDALRSACKHLRRRNANKIKGEFWLEGLEYYMWRFPFLFAASRE